MRNLHVSIMTFDPLIGSVVGLDSPIRGLAGVDLPEN